jgi:hypothetical protein
MSITVPYLSSTLRGLCPVTEQAAGFSFSFNINNYYNVTYLIGKNNYEEFIKMF